MVLWEGRVHVLVLTLVAHAFCEAVSIGLYFQRHTRGIGPVKEACLGVTIRGCC